MTWRAAHAELDIVIMFPLTTTTFPNISSARPQLRGSKKIILSYIGLTLKTGDNFSNFKLLSEGRSLVTDREAQSPFTHVQLNVQFIVWFSWYWNSSVLGYELCSIQYKGLGENIFQNLKINILIGKAVDC